MTPLLRAKVYRNIALRQQWLGLEPFDAILLGGVAWLLMMFNRGSTGWNLLVVLLAYAGLRVTKRGKPDGYTTAVLRFYLARKPFFSAADRDVEGFSHRFRSTPRKTCQSTRAQARLQREP